MLPNCVLQTRAGAARAVKEAPDVVNHPLMSTAILTDPTLFQIETVQLPPEHGTGTMTRFGTATCASTLTFDAVGRVVPPAKAVSTVRTDAPMAVRLNTTAV